MSSVDDRIVNMQFNNKQFQTGAADSTKSLETLEKTIGAMGQGKGLTDMGNGVDGIRAKFSALQVAGVTALATIVNKAVNAGLSLVKSLTLGPLVAGFKEYETNLNSIQTIIANTGKSVKVVGGYLQELNDYSDLTIYNFSQMASAIGKFTAAGVPLREATDAIKGLANTAALSGSNVDQLNTAMYQMSQALSTGTIRLMDWNSLANAGMGGKNIREALMATNRTLGDHGKAMDGAIKSSGSFRDSLQAGWLSAETFTKTMKIMAGQVDKSGKTVAFTVEALQKMGYSKEAAKRLNELSTSAIESATKVKTFSQLIDVVKESIGSGWAKVFEGLFGNFKEATKLWTGVSESITGVVGSIFDNVNLMLTGWKKLGGFENTWQGFANIFKTIGNIIAPFVAAFKAIIPATGAAGSGLAKASSAFESITGWLEKATRGLDVLTPVLTAVFGVFKNIASIADVVIEALSPLVEVLNQLGSEFSTLVKQGAGIGENIIGGLLQGMDVNSIKMAVENFATSIVDWIKGALGIASPAAELIPVGTAIVQGIAVGIGDAASYVLQAMGKIGMAIVNGFKDLFGDMDALDWTVLFNAILTGGILISLRSFTKSMASMAKDFKNFSENIMGPFTQLTSTLKSMQNEVRAAIILQIAIAVGILTASIVALSFLDPEKIAIGLGAIAGMVTILVGAMAVLSKVKPENIFSVGASMVAMSSAILILTAAIAILGNMDFETLKQGIGAFGIALGIMVVAVNLMAGIGPGIAAASAGIFIMATAMTVMAGAIAILGTMDITTLAKGIGAMAYGLGIFTIALGALTLLGPGVASSAVGIMIVAAAMTVMAGAIAILGNMSLTTLAKGIGAMTYGLGIMVVALVALTAVGPGAIASAGAIIIVASAMYILAKALTVLGQLSIAQLATGLGVIAIALGILLVAAAAAYVVAPGLIILAGSLLAIGIAAALFGVGMLAAATAFGIFVAAGTAGVALMIVAFNAFLALLPSFAVQIATALVLFVETIAAMAPRLREAFGTIIAEMLGTIQDAIPRIEAVVTELVTALLNVIEAAIPEVQDVASEYIKAILDTLEEAIPEMIETGWAILDAFVEGIEDNIDDLIDSGTAIIISLIEGIGDAALDIATAAAQTILDFINGLTAAIELYDDQIRAAGLNLALAIINGLTGGLLDEGIAAVKSAITTLANSIPGPIKKILGIESPSKEARWWGEMIVSGLVKGITDNIKYAVGATVQLANAVIAAGDKKVAKAQIEARKRQIAFEKASAKAKVADKTANKAERVADRNPNNKSLEKAAKAARKIADQQSKIADKAEKSADAAAQRVTDVKAFQAADDQGKGDIFSENAQNLSDRAIKALALANAEAIAAKKLRGKERDAMLKQAKEDAKAAKALADRSRAASEKADAYYAKAVNSRIQALEDEQKAKEQAAADEVEFNNATPAGQVEILNARADAARARSEAAFKESEALINQAKALAKTDARKAQSLLDQAEVLTQQAEDAANDAKNFADQATSISGSSTGGSFQLSTSAMEDAAAAIDRYTDSLRQAEEAAAAAAPVHQFVQNNYSPESLSEIEIYRQSKNLLSAADLQNGSLTP